jgi:hypothetical protein
MVASTVYDDIITRVKRERLGGENTSMLETDDGIGCRIGGRK